MDDWLFEKGLAISDRVLLDPAQNEQAGFHTGAMQVFMAYPFWVKALQKDLNKDSPITSQLEEVFYPWSNVIKTHEAENNKWEFEALAQSSKRSFLQQEDAPSVSPQYIQQMTALPVMRSYPLTALLTHESEDMGKIFVTANHHMLQDRFLQQVTSNVIFMENLVEYASWGEYLIGVRSRGKSSRPLAKLTDTGKSLIKWSHMLAIPLLAVLGGLITVSYTHLTLPTSPKV